MIQYLMSMIDVQRAKIQERGASAVEYALLIAGIAALIVAVVFLFKDVIIGLFNDTCASVTSDTTDTAC